MKTFLELAIIFFICCIINLNAQVDTSWVKRFNGPLNSSDGGSIVKVDDNGFVYIGCSIAKTQGYGDAAVIKYNSEGDTLWLRYYNNPYNNGSYLRDMIVGSDGNILFTGSCGGNNLEDCLTVKFDSDGNLMWSKRFDDGDIDQALAVTSDEFGNVFITGTSSKVYQSYNFLTIKFGSDGDTIWSYIWKGLDDAADIGKDIELDSYGNVLVAGTTDWYWGTVDYVTIKLNTAGDTAWVRKYDSPEHAHENLKALVIDNQDNIYITGDSYKPGGNHDIITVKYNEYGDTLWTRKYNGLSNGDDYVHAIEIDSAGNIYLAASSFVSGNGLDCLTMKYNSAGDLLWAKMYCEYSYYNDIATSITLDASGNVYVTGSAGTSSSNISYLTIKYDNLGNEKWVTKYDGPFYNGYDAANSIFVDKYGYVYITGSSAGVNSFSDIATIKYIQTASDVENNSSEIPKAFQLLQNYPNPFNPSTKISWQSPVNGHQTLKVYDVLGNEVNILVDEFKSAGKYEVDFNPVSSIKNLASGFYFYQLKAGDFIQTKKMIYLK